MSTLDNTATTPAPTTNPATKFTLNESDGQWNFTAATDQFTKTPRLTKGVPNGVTAHKFSTTVTKTNVEDGKGYIVPMADGTTLIASKVTVLFETRTPQAVAAAKEAKAMRGLVTDLKKRMGLTPGAKVAGNRRITKAQLASWVEGDAQIDGRNFAALPDETQEKLLDALEKLDVKERKAADKAAGKEAKSAVEELLKELGVTPDELKATVQAIKAQKPTE